MANVFLSVWLAIRYSAGSTFKKPLRWLLLSLFCAVAFIFFGSGSSFIFAAWARGFGVDTVFGIFLLLISFLFCLFFAGVSVKVLGRREIRIRSFFETVWCGIRGCVIIFLYLLVPYLILLCLMLTVGSASESVGDSMYSFLLIPTVIDGLGLWIFPVLFVFLVFIVVMIPALTLFARQDRFSAAFSRKDLGTMIRDAKWYWILAGIIVYAVVLFVLSFVLSFISSLFIMIPVVGIVFAVGVNCILSLFIFFFTADYWAEFFA